ncbi:MAG: hypothetical protein GY904_04505 [Planctomycetaceae bacterium]|nr:hypothetical protein [Planctomycetaceae bacterium]
MAQAGLGEAFEMGCRDGINLHYRDQIAAQQKQMGVFNDPRNPSQNGNQPGNVQTNPFAAHSPDSVIYPHSDYGTAPHANMFVRKSELEINAPKIRHNKTLSKNIAGNPFPSHWTISDVYKVISDQVVITDSSQVAPAAEDLFANSQTLNVLEPQVEAVPLQKGNKTSSRANRLQAHTVQQEATTTKSISPMPAILTRESETSSPLIDQANPQPTPVQATPQATPQAAQEPTSVTPPFIILRAEPNSEDTKATHQVPLQQSAISVDLDDEQVQEDLREKTHSRPEAMGKTTFPATSRKPITPVKNQKLIKLTARPTFSSIDRPAAPPKAHLEEPKFVQPNVVSSVLVEHLDTVAPQPGRSPVTSGKALLVAKPSREQIPTLTAQYHRLTERSKVEIRSTSDQQRPPTPPNAAKLLKSDSALEAVPYLERMLEQHTPSAPGILNYTRERR